MTDYNALFKMPTAMKITGRSSTITNAFVNAIIPIVYPTEDQIKEALSILEMTSDQSECAYCGDKANQWDHFRPLVKNKMPTGYISEIHNLVPSCSPCNTSKGGSEWKTWILGSAPQSPKSRMISDLDRRIANLEKYEQWGDASQVNFEAIAGKYLWKKYWAHCDAIKQLMKEAQIDADQVGSLVLSKFEKQKDSN